MFYSYIIVYMSLPRRMSAGLPCNVVNVRGVNVNQIQFGDKLQGLAPVTGRKRPYKSIRAKEGGNLPDRHRIFCINQLGGIGMGNKNSQFAPNADGVGPCPNKKNRRGWHGLHRHAIGSHHHKDSHHGHGHDRHHRSNETSGNGMWEDYAYDPTSMAPAGLALTSFPSFLVTDFNVEEDKCANKKSNFANTVNPKDDNGSVMSPPPNWPYLAPQDLVTIPYSKNGSGPITAPWTFDSKIVQKPGYTTSNINTSSNKRANLNGYWFNISGGYNAALPCEVDAPANIIMLASYCPNIFSEGYCKSIFSMATYQNPTLGPDSRTSWGKPGQPGSADPDYPNTSAVTGQNPGGLQTIKYYAAQAHGSVNWVVDYKTGARSDPTNPSDTRDIGHDTGVFKKDTENTRSQKAYCTISVGGSSYGPPDWLALAIGPDNVMALEGADFGKCPDLSYWNAKATCDSNPTPPYQEKEECKDLIHTIHNNDNNLIPGVGGPHSCHCVAGAAPYFLNGTTPDTTVSFGGSAPDGSLTKCRGGLCEIPWYARGDNGKGVNFGGDLREVMLDLCAKQTKASWQPGGDAQCNQHYPKCQDVFVGLLEKKTAQGLTGQAAIDEILKDPNFYNLCVDDAGGGEASRCHQSSGPQATCSDKILGLAPSNVGPGGTTDYEKLNLTNEFELWSISSHRGLAGDGTTCLDGCQPPSYIKPSGNTGCTGPTGGYYQNECPCQDGDNAWTGLTGSYIDPMVRTVEGPTGPQIDPNYPVPGCKGRGPIAGTSGQHDPTCSAKEYCGPTCEEIGELPNLDEDGGRRCYQVGCRYSPPTSAGGKGTCSAAAIDFREQTTVPCSKSGGGASSLECVKSLFAATKWCDDYLDYYGNKFATHDGSNGVQLDMNDMDHRVQCYYRVLAFTLADGFDLDYESPDQLGIMGIAMTLFCCKLKWLCGGKGAKKSPGSLVSSLATCPKVTCIITMTPLSGSSYGHPGYDINGGGDNSVAKPSDFFSTTACRNIIDEWGFQSCCSKNKPGPNTCWIPAPGQGPPICGPKTDEGQSAFCVRQPATDSLGNVKVGAYKYTWKPDNFPKSADPVNFPDKLKPAEGPMGWIYQSFLYADCPYDFVIPMLYDGGQYPSCKSGLKSNCWNTEGQGFSWEGLCSWWAYDEKECASSFSSGTSGAQPLVIPMNSNCSLVAAFIGYKDKCTFCCKDLVKFENDWWLRRGGVGSTAAGRTSKDGNNRIDGVVYFYLGDTSNYSENHIYSLLQASNDYLRQGNLPAWGPGADGFIGGPDSTPPGCTPACDKFRAGATGNICTDTCSAQDGDTGQGGQGMSKCAGSSDMGCSESAWNRWTGFGGVSMENFIYVPNVTEPAKCDGDPAKLGGLTLLTKKDPKGSGNDVPWLMTCRDAQSMAQAGKLPKPGSDPANHDYYTKAELEDTDGKIEFWLTNQGGQQRCRLKKCIERPASSSLGAGIASNEEIVWGEGCNGGNVGQNPGGLWTYSQNHFNVSFGQAADTVCFNSDINDYPPTGKYPEINGKGNSYYINGCNYVYPPGELTSVGSEDKGRKPKSETELIHDAAHFQSYTWDPPKSSGGDDKCD